MENIEWKESPTFSFEKTNLRGDEGKLGILTVPWKANAANKYMWFLFGNSETIVSG